MFKKIIASSAIACMLCACALPTTAIAATGAQGLAVYRDGVIFGEWHAAMMTNPIATDTEYCLVHALGPGDKTKFGGWLEFLGGKVFQGIREPKNTIISSYGKDLIVATARTLATENISYTVAHQMYYGAGGATVQPSEITDLRCDGVVEYCYEYNGVRIFGSDTYWNISTRGASYTNAHAGIWPESQAQNYMQVVSWSKPQ